MNTVVTRGMVVIFCMLGWSPGTIAEQPPAPRGEVRIVDKRTSNRFTIEQNRMEALVRHTDDGTLVPSLARSWHWVDDRTLDIHLRQGVTFQNGEMLDAEIVKRNLDLWREWRKYYEKPGLLKCWWLLPVESRIDILDPYTIRLVLPAPDAETLLRLRFQFIGNRQL